MNKHEVETMIFQAIAEMDPTRIESIDFIELEDNRKIIRAKIANKVYEIEIRETE